nr:hypothetical protein [Tanacetum cinerariifolium]
GNPQQDLQDKGVIDSGFSRKNNIYSVDLKNIVPKGDLIVSLQKPHLINLNFGSTSGIRARALRNFNLEVMEFEPAQNNTTAKLPILKLASTVSSNVNTASPQVSIANFSDNAAYAFIVENPNEPEFKGYGLRDSKLESNINDDTKSDDSKENSDDSFVKQQVSEDTSSFVESPLNVDKETAISVDKKIEFVKPKNYDKPVRNSVRASHKRMIKDLLTVDAQGT